MKVTILYDAAAETPTAAPDVAGVLASVAAIEDALAALGHEPARLGADGGRAWVERLRGLGTDIVFNLCEGIAGDASAEADVAATLEAARLPFTGAGSTALRLARRKDHVNHLLSGGVPVPAWILARPDAVASWRHFPAIVKPAGSDAGIGITGTAVAHAPEQLAGALHAARDHEPLLVQEFLPGIELVVGFVGSARLPVAEVDYTDMPSDLPRVVGYAAKWELDSDEDRGTRTRCPADITDALESQAIATARAAWRALSSRGYARVDLRADEHDVLHVLDVNPNPDLAPDAGLARMAAAAGWTYTDLIDRILRDAAGDTVSLR